ncbi:relaxase/mobilization nuclease domain-containing protein [Skermanella sp. TT6]|uniref:Relaxase/mobilization nuclease domain-containing protein n=1 Tax=Skermanella cutis TaxID=2775420 RepID=A0ABX7B928_9PROT|nr:relaxase/mobilization nuclease domain-containing protein [Skermanella sp. TT6]QQP90638.1 relaxase/mobilization nuclease domain-containing protein [Skermanella sp. TT6]
MLIKGQSRGDPRGLAAHLLKGQNDERPEVLQIRGSASAHGWGALADFDDYAATARRPPVRTLMHVSFNPAPEDWSSGAMTPALLMEIVDRAEHDLGLSGHPRLVVRHVKHAREHYHVVWARTDPATGRTASDSYTVRTLMGTARRAERQYGLRQVHDRPTAAALRPACGRRHDGPPTPGRARRRTHAREQAAVRTGLPVAEVSAVVVAAWTTTDSAPAFRDHLAGYGLVLAWGDGGKRGRARGLGKTLLAVDEAGVLHNVRMLLPGIRKGELMMRMGGTDLPDPAGAKKAAKEIATMLRRNLDDARQEIAALRAHRAELDRLARVERHRRQWLARQAWRERRRRTAAEALVAQLKGMVRWLQQQLALIAGWGASLAGRALVPGWVGRWIPVAAQEAQAAGPAQKPLPASSPVASPAVSTEVSGPVRTAQPRNAAAREMLDLAARGRDDAALEAELGRIMASQRNVRIRNRLRGGSGRDARG